MQHHTRCAWVRGRIDAHVDAAASNRDVQKIVAHLESCAACKQEVAELRALKRVLQAARIPEEPWATRDRVFARFQAGVRVDRMSAAPWWQRHASLSLGLVASCAALVALLIPMTPTPSVDVLPHASEMALLSERHDIHVEHVTQTDRVSAAGPGYNAQRDME